METQYTPYIVNEASSCDNPRITIDTRCVRRRFPVYEQKTNRWSCCEKVGGHFVGGNDRGVSARKLISQPWRQQPMRDRLTNTMYVTTATITPQAEKF